MKKISGMRSRSIRLSGKSLPKSAFQFSTSEGVPSKRWIEIARGELIGEIVKGFLDEDASDRIRRNFESSASLRQREDGVPGQTLGVDLYKSAPDDYVERSLMVRADLNRLFRGTINVPMHLRESLQRLLPMGQVVRPAIYDGIEYNTVRGIRWPDATKFSLRFHDDQAQLRDLRQADMETYQLQYPVAFNVYPSVSEKGGELVVYNIAPDDQSREALGLAYTGYPYPEELLTEFDRLTVAAEAGDLVILSGRFIHGVTGIRGKTPRILLNQFGGFIDPTTFVTWS